MVKLGTITKNDADVFSYDEDDSVRDPNLRQHLMHFGIDMETVEKTEKSTLEMELDLNQRQAFSCFFFHFEKADDVRTVFFGFSVVFICTVMIMQSMLLLPCF